ncbi:MAG: hypothetical protein CMP62_00035 [Flavobacteriales bacterium]|nr:hypothetical protein [Flavobacteriales bacterium]|tara:strand:- start:5194 stop:5559 length:366 start_codon:yes stop_codon:yes gene_type:complete
MNPYKSNFLNSLVLIFLGAWGASPFLFSAGTSGSLTSLIPFVFGIILLILGAGLKKENKTIAHLVVLFTLMIFVSLFMPLNGALDRSDTIATIRILIMLLTSLLALITFIQSFIEARKKKS